jgi:hypothetical protein
MFTVRDALTPYIKQTRFVFKGLIPLFEPFPVNQDKVMSLMSKLPHSPNIAHITFNSVFCYMSLISLVLYGIRFSFNI